MSSPSIETVPFGTETSFQLLVEAVSDYAIFLLNKDGIIMTWNKGAERLKQYSGSEIIGTHFSRFYTEPDILRNHPAFELKEALAHGTYSEEGWRLRKDGTRFWALVTITAVTDRKGTHYGFAKVTRDLTERKMVEDKLREMNEDLENRVHERTRELENAKEHAEAAVKTRDDFLSIASHELKTPITALLLRNSARLKLMGKAQAFSPEQLLKMFQDDQKQFYRLNHLIDDMLDVQKLKIGKFNLNLEEVNLSDLVKDVIGMHKAQLAEIEIRAQEGLEHSFLVEADKLRIEQVISNILINSLKYGAGKPVCVNVVQEENFAKVSIADQGIGISLENQMKIFQQFERVNDPQVKIGGLGLGLYISKQIVEAHHGNIKVESVLGKGSTFFIYLPLI